MVKTSKEFYHPGWPFNLRFFKSKSRENSASAVRNLIYLLDFHNQERKALLINSSDILIEIII